MKEMEIDIQLLKRTVAKGATDDEVRMFLHVCKKYGLDPFMKQIYFMRQEEGWSYVISIDGLRAIAERTGSYRPGKIEVSEDGKCATASVWRKIGEEWHEVSATAYLSESIQMAKDGRPRRMWAKMPRTMLGKCAEAMAIRRAFPTIVGGLHATEEMGQEEEIEDIFEIEEKEGEKKDEKKKNNGKTKI